MAKVNKEFEMIREQQRVIYIAQEYKRKSIEIDDFLSLDNIRKDGAYWACFDALQSEKENTLKRLNKYTNQGIKKHYFNCAWLDLHVYTILLDK